MDRKIVRRIGVSVSSAVLAAGLVLAAGGTAFAAGGGNGANGGNGGWSLVVIATRLDLGPSRGLTSSY